MDVNQSQATREMVSTVLVSEDPLRRLIVLDKSIYFLRSLPSSIQSIPSQKTLWNRQKES